MDIPRNKNPTISYKSFVEAKTRRSPCLKNLSEFFQNGTAVQHTGHIACLEFSSSTRQPSRRSLDLKGLASMLRSTTKERDDLCGRLLIVEDISNSVIEVLGSSLNIDPFFFASHIDAFQPEIATARPSMNTLPSTTRSQNFLNLHYHRVIEFENLDSREVLRRNTNVLRKVKMLPQLQGINVGLVRHCCSIMNVKGRDGTWLGKRDSLAEMLPHRD